MKVIHFADKMSVRSGIPYRFRGARFDNYVAEAEPQRRALAACEDYLERFCGPESKGASLILSGKSGTGKTHLACAILAGAIKAGKDVKYSDFFEMKMDMKELGRRAFRERYMAHDLLVIDDVGFPYCSDEDERLLYQVVNDRYGDIKSTVVVTSWQVESLEERLVDRMREGGGAVVAFDWGSYRR